MTDHARLRAALAERGGVSVYADLIRDVGRRALERGCHDGVVRAVARGVYVSPGLDQHLATRARCGGGLSHLSAAVRHGWSLQHEPKGAHLTLPPNSRRATGPGVTRVYYRKLRVQVVVDHVTEPLRTVVDCARDLPFEEALTVADSALRCPGCGSRRRCVSKPRGSSQPSTSRTSRFGWFWKPRASRHRHARRLRWGLRPLHRPRMPGLAGAAVHLDAGDASARMGAHHAAQSPGPAGAVAAAGVTVASRRSRTLQTTVQGRATCSTPARSVSEQGAARSERGRRRWSPGPTRGRHRSAG